MLLSPWRLAPLSNPLFYPFAVPPGLGWRETPEAFVLEVPVPGFGPDHIRAEVAAGRLRIVGERPDAVPGWRHFATEMPLPRGADPDRLRVDVHDGLLTAVAPKLWRATVRRIPVLPGGGRAASGEIEVREAQASGVLPRSWLRPGPLTQATRALRRAWHGLLGRLRRQPPAALPA